MRVGTREYRHEFDSIGRVAVQITNPRDPLGEGKIRFVYAVPSSPEVAEVVQHFESLGMVVEVL